MFYMFDSPLLHVFPAKRRKHEKDVCVFAGRVSHAQRFDQNWKAFSDGSLVKVGLIKAFFIFGLTKKPL